MRGWVAPRSTLPAVAGRLFARGAQEIDSRDRYGPPVKTLGTLFLICGAFLALSAAAPARATEIVTRNAKDVRLATDNHGRAMVTYEQGGRMWHVFYSGAINAKTPNRVVP